ncbi:hypothetical protein [Spirosoma endbachense]|uniref:Uncharacterized protein n=1 Tax=Spirosoma endbachense TaxID=2666025 RepID=A0A6P1W0U0_9BACT|nr:hypothetical protein [Spirosoma endbachense]QHV97296.1 hypothetical protein GJR95_20805 [Spirosoma endbachense]
MGRLISLFTDYSQLENRVTNYCGLLLKLLYEDSPRRFSDLLDKLTEGTGNLIIGPVFEQQQRQQKSVPDLVISQQAFTIAVETKLNDWFYDEQLVNHLQGLRTHSGTLILFLLSNFESDPRDKFQIQINQAKQKNILLIPLSYEHLLEALEKVCITDYLRGLIDDFREFIDSKGLLPRWKYLLDVVNCAGTLHEIEAGVYLCPDTGGAYRHKRARYFGPYANKAVRQIFEVDAVATVSTGLEEVSFKWINRPEADKEALTTKAREYVAQFRLDDNRHTPIQVFVLGKRQKRISKKTRLRVCYLPSCTSGMLLLAPPMKPSWRPI